MGKKGRTDDPIAVVETAYDLQLEADAWLQTLVDAAAPDLDRGHGLFACRYRLNDGDRLELDGSVAMSSSCESVSFVEAFLGRRHRLDPSLVRRLFRFGPVIASFEDLRDWGFLSDDELEAQRSFLRQYGFADVLSVRVHDSGASHCFLGAPMAEPRKTPPPFVERWERLAAHIAAGARLRASLQRSDPRQGAEAIFDPDGAMHHIGDTLRSTSAQERLRRAVLSVENVRARRHPGDEALTLWKGLIDGKWSLVDSFDSAGRRYVVARRNDPDVRDPRALTPRERQVASLLAQGHSDKLIAYELGLSGSTIHHHVRSIVSKLGAGTRVVLVKLLRQLHADRLADEPEDDQD